MPKKPKPRKPQKIEPLFHPPYEAVRGRVHYEAHKGKEFDSNPELIEIENKDMKKEQKRTSRTQAVSRVAARFLGRTARVLTEKEGLNRLKKSLEDNSLLFAWWQETGVKGKLEVKGNKIIYTSPRWQYFDGENDYVMWANTNHSNVVKKNKKYVKDYLEHFGHKVFRVEAKVFNKGTDLSYDDMSGAEIQVDAGEVQVFAEIDLPKYMRTATLKDIAKEMKAEGYTAFMQGDVLNVVWQSGGLRKWEYARWDMNLTQYQDANNKLHQEWADKLQKRYPKHVVEPENGYHEGGYSVALIKMP